MDNRKKIIGSILGALLITAVFVVPVLAKKPLYGEMTLSFNLGWFPHGAQPNVPDWVGTITIDGKPYGMLFFAIGSGKPFATDPPGKVHFFEEIWAIYDIDFDLTSLIVPFGEISDPDDWDEWLPQNSPDMVMWGYDQGLTNKQNKKYHMTGSVEEALGDFTEWEGRQVYMSGVILFDGGLPSEAPGIFRIN